jgi:tetratricopeptide (TPR) repeat protein
MENYQEASRCFKKQLQIVPGHGAIFYNLASMASYQRNEQKALTYLSRAVRSIPLLKKHVEKDRAFEWLSDRKEFLAIMR